MHILVVNCGSSSIKFSLFNSGKQPHGVVYEGELSGIGTVHAGFTFRGGDGHDLKTSTSFQKPSSPAEAIRIVASAISRPGLPVAQAIGYRVVHPGPLIRSHQRITPALLHSPASLEVIHEMMDVIPDVAHYACFDTVFHQTMPSEATTYPIPDEYTRQGVRRYGFHGLSCESIVDQLRQAEANGEVVFPQRLIIAHLGSGCSVTALKKGCSVDNTMGLTPTGGVVMGTRPGDLDPGLILYLLRERDGDTNSAADRLERLLNQSSGLLALSGLANDMRSIRAAAVNGNERAKFALKVFTRSVRKAIGGYMFLLGGVDAIVFTGGIGEHDAQTQQEILGGLEGMGIELDASSSEHHQQPLKRISALASAVDVFVVPAAEDRMIAQHVDQIVRSQSGSSASQSQVGHGI